MPRTCTVCSHPDRAEIETALVASETSFRDIARRFSVSKDAVTRHRAEHLPEKLAKAAEADELADADQLKAELETVKADVHRLKGKAEKEGDYRTALTGCDRALKALELQAKLLQLIGDASQVNLYLSPEWLELRAVVVGALEPHPAARESVLRALEGVGNGGA